MLFGSLVFSMWKVEEAIDDAMKGSKTVRPRACIDENSTIGLTVLLRGRMQVSAMRICWKRSHTSRGRPVEESWVSLTSRRQGADFANRRCVMQRNTSKVFLFSAADLEQLVQVSSCVGLGLSRVTEFLLLHSCNKVCRNLKLNKLS